MRIVEQLLSDFGKVHGSSTDVTVVRAPGRVNLIGDHTDYNDGFVLPITIDRAVYAALRPRSDETVAVYAANFEEEVRYRLTDRPPSTAGSWISYVAGAIEELRLGGHGLRGVEMVVYGDVPLGAGLSSSAALEVAVVFGLDVTFDLRLDPIDAIRLCQRVEHRYAGVECGIMDQFVARLGRRGHALLLDCRSLEHDHVPLAVSAADVALVIADTRVSRELAASKYGERRMECRGAVSSIRERHPGVRSLRDVTVEMLVEHRAAMGETFYRRARHVVDENARVLQARDALADGSYERFGRLMQASHTSLRDLYEVSSAELDTLVDAAMRTDGVFGARMTGGGFGGCTVQLLRPTALEPLRDALTAAYMDRHGRRPSIYVVERNHHTERLQGP